MQFRMGGDRMTEVKKVFSRSSSGQPRGGRSLTSVREKEIVRLVVQGYRNRDIAERLFIKELTVKETLDNIFDRLAVADRLELALYAIQHRLIDAPDPQPPRERGSGFSLVRRIQNACVGLRQRFRK